MSARATGGHDRSAGGSAGDGPEHVDSVRSRLVVGYWDYYRHTSSTPGGFDADAALSADDGFDAWEAVEDAVSSQDPGLVSLLVALAEAVQGDAGALAYLGAGPIETLLRHSAQPPSSRLLDELDAAARRHPDLGVAMESVWWSDDDDPNLVARFHRPKPR